MYHAPFFITNDAMGIMFGVFGLAGIIKELITPVSNKIDPSLPHKLPQLILRKVPCAKQAELSCFLSQHLVVVIELLCSEAGTAGGDCKADRTECLGEFGCCIVSGGSFEDLSDCIFDWAVVFLPMEA